MRMVYKLSFIYLKQQPKSTLRASLNEEDTHTKNRVSTIVILDYMPKCCFVVQYKRANKFEEKDVPRNSSLLISISKKGRFERFMERTHT